MAQTDWKQIKDIFVQALGQKEEVRQEFLENVCENKNVLREVNSLLASYDSAESFMEIPADVEFTKPNSNENSHLTKGQKLKHYEIIEQIGEGGMGQVYLAQDTKLKRNVALKLLPAEFIDNKDFLRRFEQEAFAASSLNHPNIITIYEVGKNEETNFIVTEFIEGKTLREKLRENPIELKEILNIAVQAASALVTSHKARIIHRDIKPENIMIREDGIVKLLDFGLAKPIEIKTLEIKSEDETKPQVNTKKGVIMGTPQYMSPEQARGKTVDGRTDIWSLGIVFYEMITGTSPFAEETPSDTIAAILKTKPKPFPQTNSDFFKRFENIVRKCLQKKAKKRYQNTKDLLADLEDLKQDVEFESKLEKSVQPNLVRFNENEGEKTAIIKEQDSVEQIATTAEQRNISSAEYITESVKQNKFAVFGVLAVLIVSAIAISYYFYSNSTSSTALTDKDIILLADFENKTDEDIFDGTLKQGLLFQLRQSPFLSIFSEEQARKTLELMKRSKEERITRKLAKEICQREGLKAYIVGTIAKLGATYVLTLEAVKSVNGEKLAIEQVEADSKEKILQALSQASTKIRKKLGESLATLEKFDKPIQALTTKSLEALQAYSMALKQQRKGNAREGLSLYKRAVEIDPDFAAAHLSLAAAYGYNKQYEKRDSGIAKAYKLREKASEWERLLIDNWYFQYIVKDTRKTIEVLKRGKNLYPKEPVFRSNLGFTYSYIGQIENAIEEIEEIIRLTRLKITNDPGWQKNLAPYYLLDNRFDDAKKASKESIQRNPDIPSYQEVAFKIAFIEENNKKMQEQINWFKGRYDEFKILHLKARGAAFQGKFKESQKLSQQAIVFIKQTENKEAQILYSVVHESTATIFGDCSNTNSIEKVPMRLIENYNPATFTPISLARCGKLSEAEKQINQFKEKYPQSTLGNGLWIPMFKAQIELEKGNPQEAVDFLENAKRYEWAAHAYFYPQFIKGQAHLKLGENEKAKAEFQKILDNRGKAPLSVFYPLAQLGKARAMKDKAEYEKFFEWWKDADEDLEILIEAKKEYEALE